ncbi:MAG: retropepsin-like aspartic protease [Dehalococcoidia bacterium]
MIGLRYQHHYNGPDDYDLINVVVRVFGTNEAPPISINALLDTGAEHSVFDKALLPLLEIADVTVGTPYLVQTADNREAMGYLHDLDVEFLGYQFTVPVGFVPAWPEGIDNLLGMGGFFDQMVFGIDHRTRNLAFNPHASANGS